MLEFSDRNMEDFATGGHPGIVVSIFFSIIPI